jgi:hypothetical protein
MIRAFFISMALAGPAVAGEADDFVTANVISTLYHEFGHAIIDLTDAPVLGREEDAADILSVVLLDAFWEEDFAKSITKYTALSFELSAENGDEPAYWDVHGLDMQRYYNQVCLFYGAAPETREGLITEYELPEERADTCAEEFDLAADSWAGILEPLETTKPSRSLVFSGDQSSDIGALLASEVEDLNAIYTLPHPIAIKLESCGEENAFYDPGNNTITICTEYVDFLRAQAEAADL